MMQKRIVQYSLLNALFAAGYVALVGLFISNAEKIFGHGDNTITAIAFLLTFVFSAAIMGISIFGRSVLWYFDGKKKEAVVLLFYTLGFLFSILLVVFFVLLMEK